MWSYRASYEEKGDNTVVRECGLMSDVSKDLFVQYRMYIVVEIRQNSDETKQWYPSP